MTRLGRDEEINDHYIVFNRYFFICSITFNYGFDNSRPQELKYFFKNPLTTKGFYAIMITETR